MRSVWALNWRHAFAGAFYQLLETDPQMRAFSPLFLTKLTVNSKKAGKIEVKATGALSCGKLAWLRQGINEKFKI